MSSLFDSFLALPIAATSSEFHALPLNPRRRDFLAKNESGAPIFLLHDSSAVRYNPGINFRHLSAQFHATCRVRVDAVDLEDQFCLVWCDAAVPDLHELFVRCVSAAIEELPERSGTKDLEACIAQLHDLFRALAMPNGREVSGLWAELFVISQCENSALALSQWRTDQFDRFDFSSSKICLEVKSSVRGLRAHEFALEQLRPSVVSQGFVASVLLQPLTGGVGVLDLARDIEIHIRDAHLKQKLWKNVATSLGGDFSDKLDRQFDLSFATRNLMVYSMSDIPQPDVPSDSRISALRFVSDLTAVMSSLGNAPFTTLARVFSE